MEYSRPRIGHACNSTSAALARLAENLRQIGAGNTWRSRFAAIKFSNGGKLEAAKRPLFPLTAALAL